ncbi:MAG: ABC transporter ATP-binding protein [Clostridiales bacterium]|nr:ABC transporter ATP-binding protein [Clostridiales bacterium]
MKYQSESGEIEAVREVSFSVYEGEFVSIVGPSGCGKSTLLSIIAGLTKPSSGQVTLLGEPVVRGARSVGYMLQKDHLFEWRTIEQNTLLGLEVRRDLTPETRAYAQELLKTYDLWAFKDSYPRELSGGMRQRAALIRTLATRPSILLLDEAFSALDYQTRLSVTEDIHDIIKQVGATAILVTHDISESIALSDRVLVLSARPAELRAVHHIDMAGLSSRQRRDHPEFRSYFNLVRKELGLNGKS